MEKLKKRFNYELLKQCKEAELKLGYKAEKIRTMFYEHGGVETCRRLIKYNNARSDFISLWDLPGRRLDLTMEALIFDNQKFHKLFPVDGLSWVNCFTIEYASDILKKYGYPDYENCKRRILT